MDESARDALSIFAAARDAGATIGVRASDRCYTFAELAELTRERLRSLPDAGGGLFPVTADNSLQTIVTLYALLERRIPALLLHPTLAAAERDALLAAARGRSAHADAAAVIHTSGTTGAPRGAVLTRSALVASAQAGAANLGWFENDCWLLAMPVARVGGLSIVTRCLIARRTVAIAAAFDAQSLPQRIEEQRITLLSLVPTMLALTLDAHPRWQAPAFLRAILLGGAAASGNLLRRARERRLPIVITYGMTETCSQVVATPYEFRFETGKHGAGRPLPGAQVRIDRGRILVRGPMRMAGYLNEPALAPDDWFDTGDVGEFDASGCLHVHARSGDLIISGGNNVYPAEVERVLEELPGIKAAGVFGEPDETWGQIVVAALVIEGPPPDEAALRAHLEARLSPHKRPRRFHFVAQLPQTPAGKLDRAALPAMLRNGDVLLS